MSQTILSSIKSSLDFREVSLQKGLFNTPLNSIKFHKFRGTEQNKRFFSQIMSRAIYITCGNFKSFHIICPQIYETKFDELPTLQTVLKIFITFIFVHEPNHFE